MYKNDHYPFQMIKLPYEFFELSPFLSSENLKNHYLIYYQDYLNHLNNYLSNHLDYQNLTLDELLFNYNVFPKESRNELLKYAGGVHNHQLYFESMSNKSKLRNGSFKSAIINNFGSYENFELSFKEKAKSLNSHGFLFLVCDEHGLLSLFPCPNEETPVPLNLCPIMAIDLYEHAYYLDYLNDLDAYVENFLSHLNYDYIEKQYEECLKYIAK